MNKDFCIISNNCWGAEVYKAAHLGYNTPFVGLFVPPLCFVKLCNDLAAYLNSDLIFINESKYKDYKGADYPIALLGDVEIHFVHYKDREEAIAKWHRRVERMPTDKNRIFVKGDDREVADLNDFSRAWNKIPYKKILFSKTNNTAVDHLIWLSEYSNKPSIPDGKILYKVSNNHVNIFKWLSNQPYKRSVLYTKLFTFIYSVTPRRFR